MGVHNVLHGATIGAALRRHYAMDRAKLILEQKLKGEKKTKGVMQIRKP